MRTNNILNTAFAFLISALILTSCTTLSDPSPLEQSGPEIVVDDATQMYEHVDERLWTYFERFEKEAKLRGAFVNLKEGKIHANFVVMAGSDFATSSYDPVKDLTFIDFNKDLWISNDNSFKEWMVFHCLGLDYLGRGYDDTQTSNGYCQSLMRSPGAACTDNYNANTREFYLDELFTN